MGTDARSDRERRTETEVTVERETEPEPETGSEAAVKGAESTGSTGSTGAEPGAETEPAAGEPAAGSGSGAGSGAAAAAAQTEPEAETESETEAGGDPVTDLKGIGPAYGDRLEEVGIGSIEDLAAADAAEVADQISVGENRVQRWIDRAKDR